MKQCPQCGSQAADDATSCPSCGSPLPPLSAPVTGAPSGEIPPQGLEQTVFTNEDRSLTNPKRNTLGIVGFILSLCAFVVAFIPGISTIMWFVWVVGFVVSFVGIFFNPKGLAIAGLVISLVVLVIFMAACSALFGVAAATGALAA